MTTASIDDEYEEFDDLEDDEEDRGLSGLMVLLMGIVMFGAIASVVFYAYRHGVKTGESYATTRTITADPEPIKVENLALDDTPDNDCREVYDRMDGAPSNPVEVIARGPEEPIDRSDDAEDIFSNVVVEAPSSTAESDDAVADRIAQLAAADAALSEEPSSAPSTPAQRPEPRPVTTPQVVSASATPTVANGGALSGTHPVQVGAFRSDGIPCTHGISPRRLSRRQDAGC